MVDVKETEGFQRFWKIWPRKVAKRAALRAWHKQSCEPLTEVICTAVEKQVQYNWQGSQRKYIPHPGSWLTSGRWEDEIEVPAAPVPATSHPTTARMEPAPQLDEEKAFLNRVMMVVLRKHRGTTLSKVQEMIDYRNHVAAQWKDLPYEDRDEMLDGVIKHFESLV